MAPWWCIPRASISLGTAAYLFAERVGVGGCEHLQEGLCPHAFTFPKWAVCVGSPTHVQPLALKHQV